MVAGRNLMNGLKCHHTIRSHSIRSQFSQASQYKYPSSYTCTTYSTGGEFELSIFLWVAVCMCIVHTECAVAIARQTSRVVLQDSAAICWNRVVYYLHGSVICMKVMNCHCNSKLACMCMCMLLQLNWHMSLCVCIISFPLTVLSLLGVPLANY